MTHFSKDIKFSFNSGYIMAPICLKKLQLDVFLNWNRRVLNYQSKINYTDYNYLCLYRRREAHLLPPTREKICCVFCRSAPNQSFKKKLVIKKCAEF